MARAANKTVRFTKVVERSGQPHVHTLWLPPEKDPEFKRARDNQRLMTLESSGGKTDVGIVGFDSAKEKGAQFLIFPKSLKSFDGARVIGIKFDLIEQPRSVAAIPERISRKPKTPLAKTAGRARLRPTHRAGAPAKPMERERTSSREAGEAPALTPAAPTHGETHPPRTPRTPPPSRSRPSPKTKRSTGHPAAADARLVREIRAAMKELEGGKSVAAYQRLERAVADS